MWQFLSWDLHDAGKDTETQVSESTMQEVLSQIWTKGFQRMKNGLHGLGRVKEDTKRRLHFGS